MLGLAKRVKARILLASTSEVYGDPNVHPQPESYWGSVNPIGVRACYDEGKRCAETLFFDYWRQHRLRIKVARIFNTYGPRMHPDDGRVVSNFIRQALRGEDITIYGKGDQTRSFCYVDDLIEALIRLMNTPDDFTGPITSAIRSNRASSSWPSGSSHSSARARRWSSGTFRRMTRASVNRTSRSRGRRWTGNRRSASTTG